MNTGVASLSPSDYATILAQYVRSHSEESLYRASLLSQVCIESGLGPEDLVSLHFDALESVLEGIDWREQARAHADGQAFLLEVMIAYGVHFREYLQLKLTEALRDAESQSAREREHIHELERLQTEKDQILAVIAHELRTPLTAAQGSLEMVARSVAAGRVDQVDTLIRNAREALDRLSRLSADLVEASRGTAPEIVLGSLDLRPVLEQARRWAAPAAAAKGISLSSVEASTQTHALAEADALLSIFGNLFSNAIRYTPPGGQVSTHVHEDGDWLCVEIADTGIGMPPEVQDRIFERFYRAPEAARLEARGLGLGLALVQQMVQALQGRISVESAPNYGTTFRIYLQASPAGDRQGGQDG